MLLSQRGGSNMINYEEIDKKAIELFNKGMSLSKISKELNIGRWIISKRFRNIYGIDTSLRKDNKLYSINNCYFEKIDTEEKAYWLGFLFADGYMRTQSYTVELGLARRDESHLIKFNTCINSTYPIRHKTSNVSGKTHDVSLAMFCDKKAYKDLERLGCLNRKTYHIDFPCFDDKVLKVAFVRGFFDGDGSIGIAKKRLDKSKIQKIGFAAYSEEILEKVAMMVKDIFPEFKYKIYRKKDTCSCSLFSTKTAQSREFLSIIYKDSNIYLDRKYKVYEQFCRPYEKLYGEKQAKSVKAETANTEVS